MDTLCLNGFDIPITRHETRLSSIYRGGIERLTPRILNPQILDMSIDTDCTYTTTCYFDLFDANGNKVKEDYKEFIETRKDIKFWDELHGFSTRSCIMYLKGDFRIINLLCEKMNRQEDVERVAKILSTYQNVDYNWNRYTETRPYYILYRGSSLCCIGTLSRSDLQMTYKQLKQKVKRIKLLANNNKHDIWDRYYEEWIEDSTKYIIKAICDYLMISESAYKSGKYDIVNCLIKRLNFNINNR